MINHQEQCSHPQTPEGRRWCRKMKLADRPTFAEFAENTTSGYIIRAQDSQGRSLDLNGTDQGDVFQVWSVKDAMWVLDNLRYGVDHDFDAETHVLRKVAEIHLAVMGVNRHSPSGWSVNDHEEIYTIHADGTRTYRVVNRKI